MTVENKIQAAIDRSDFSSPAIAFGWVRDSLISNGQWFVSDLSRCRFTFKWFDGVGKVRARFTAVATLCFPDAGKTVTKRVIFTRGTSGKFKRVFA